MKRNSYEIKREGKPGSIVWACAYRINSRGTGKLFYSAPVEGMLMLGNTQLSHDRKAKAGYTQPKYFVPLRKKGGGLAWSKAVTIGARKYADSKEECEELLSDILDKEIVLHNKRVDIVFKQLEVMEKTAFDIRNKNKISNKETWS